MKVAVLMSGGVDSTVSAILLQEQGHEVLGLTMINWDESVGRRAAETARKLGIKHRIINLQAFFQERVIDYFCRSYEAGLTPNPCVECNKYVKFGVLLDKAFEIGCDKVATGHYARIEYDAGRNRYLLKKGMDTQKDQSYFLYGLKQDQLAHILFPLGEYQKKQVKDLARQRGLEAADAKESQEICFISGDYRDFIRERTSLPGGLIKDREGRVLGRHHGLHLYTVGQRKGLGVSGGRPLYVTALDMINNTLWLGDNEDLFSSTLFAEQNNFIYISQLDGPRQVQAKIRYAAQPAPAAISLENDRVRVDFVSPQRAVTPGQSVVYYVDDYVLGGGVIV